MRAARSRASVSLVPASGSTGAPAVWTADVRPVDATDLPPVDNIANIADEAATSNNRPRITGYPCIEANKFFLVFVAS